MKKFAIGIVSIPNGMEFYARLLKDADRSVLSFNSQRDGILQRLKSEAATTEAVTDAKANFSHVKLSDAKNARGVYETVLLDSKAFCVDELKKLSDSEIKAIYMGMRVNAKNKDNSGSVLDKFYDAKPEKIDLNKKFGGK